MSRKKKAYIVPVSGGKDSQAVLAWAIEKHSTERIRACHQYTGFDHSVTYAHLAYMEKRYGLEIEITRSKKYKNIFDLIRKKQHFPRRQARSCTSRLKQEPFAEWLVEEGLDAKGAAHVYFGMRAEESASRKHKYGDLKATDRFTLSDLSSMYGEKFSGVTVSLPIVRWSTERVFKFLADRGDRVNPLYARGHHRVGCYPCLLAGNREWELASHDKLGRSRIKTLIAIENKFKKENNPRKLITVHQTRDVRALLATHKCTNRVDTEDGCGLCSI